MNNFIIYGLYCPITNDLHYVGKSSVGLIRPLTHLTQSHSDKINEWVSQLKFLGHAPVIKILEVCTENNLDENSNKIGNSASFQWGPNYQGTIRLGYCLNN